jgi:hypothetical protein
VIGEPPEQNLGAQPRSLEHVEKAELKRFAAQ